MSSVTELGSDSLPFCRACGAPVRLEMQRQGAKIGSVSPVETIVWSGIRFQGQAATSLCTVMAFFCSDEHLDEWRAENRDGRGFRMTVEEALQVGKAIFAPFLAQDA